MRQYLLAIVWNKTLIIALLSFFACQNTDRKEYLYSQSLVKYLQDQGIYNQIIANKITHLLIIPDFDCSDCLISEFEFLSENISSSVKLFAICTRNGKGSKVLESKGIMTFIDVSNKAGEYSLNMGPGICLDIRTLQKISFIHLRMEDRDLQSTFFL